MNCPKCNVQLSMMERQGVEIDYCPQCRGVWLDRGELDKILERAGPAVQAASAPPVPGGPPPLPSAPQTEHRRRRDYDDDDDDDYRYGRQGDRAPHSGKKKKGFFSELFDF
jgi:Zn-finger nucleic acid-binding protein